MSVNDPIARFLELQQRAERNGEAQRATAMTLATTTPDGRPSARMVLLKGADERGFVFYTNYGSRKAAELDATRRAALVFYWPTLDKQIRVEGTVTRVSAAEADAYFATRPRQSQLGAWASRQSDRLKGRRELVVRYLTEKARHLGHDIPRPEFWGGYLLDPARIEFWEARLGRLHDRTLFTRADDGGWQRQMLYP